MMKLFLSLVLLTLAVSIADAFAPVTTTTTTITNTRKHYHDAAVKTTTATTTTQRWANSPKSKSKTRKSNNPWDDWVQDMFQRPLHGHGTGADKLGTIHKEDLSVLKDRKKHYRKEQLHEKYATKNQSWLDHILSQPFHGRGSGQDKMDKMYQAQQQVLYERREYYGNKQQLRKKYATNHVDRLKDIPVHPDDPVLLNQKEDAAMYFGDKNNDTEKGKRGGFLDVRPKTVHYKLEP